MIIIIGLGAAELEQMPLGIYKLLQDAKHIFVRTKQHPVLAVLATKGLKYTSFDAVYERHDTFDAVYEEIAQTLIDASRQEDIIYAVPGHPMVAEKTVQLLIASTAKIEIKGGQSFIDALLTSLKIDPIEGLQFLDATNFKLADLSLQQHLIFCQVYNPEMASNVKLALLEILPPDYDVIIITAAGSKQELIKRVKLFEVDHDMALNSLTSIYIPPAPEALLRQEFSVLRKTVKTLRGPNGCPWDQIQSHQSLKGNLIEETQELLKALDEPDNDEQIVEELGDVLLQVMLHAQIGEDAGWFKIDDVILGLNEKLIRRHPHVFGDATAKTPAEAMALWQHAKQQEK